MVTYTYVIATATFNGIVANSALAKEIRASSITIALDRVDTTDTNLYVVFKVALSTAEITTLDTLVSNHQGIPLTTPKTSVITEDKSGVQGIYRTDQIVFDVPANSIASGILQVPYPIRITSVDFTPYKTGDSASAVVSENTVIGTLTTDANIGDTILNVSSTVITNIKIGYEFELTDGINSNTSDIIEIDVINSTITIDVPLTNSFLAVTPTYCKMTIPFTEGFIEFVGGVVMRWGQGAIGGSLLPANTPLKIYYKNTDSVQVRAIFHLELWY